METESKHIVITDGWHPTINPSSRMPIHHHRFIELLGTNDGVLNELPRSYGGGTLRAMHINIDGNLNIIPLNKAIKYMPWWVPASSDRAISTIRNIIAEATSNVMCISTEAYKTLLNTYLMYAEANSYFTFGEALNQANNYLYRRVYPSLPEINLASLTRLSLTHIMSEGLQNLSSNLFEILNAVGNTTGKKEFGFLGVFKSYKNLEWRLTYLAGQNVFVLVTLSKPYITESIEIDNVVELLYNGQFLPSSQLLIAIELSLTQLGYTVTHYGNAYEKHEVFSQASGINNVVKCWDDDNDSWNFAMLQGVNSELYPLHLLDLLSFGDKVIEAISNLIARSLLVGKPIIVRTKRGGDVLEALSN